MVAPTEPAPMIAILRSTNGTDFYPLSAPRTLRIHSKDKPLPLEFAMSAKINQHTDFHPCSLQIVQQLRLVSRIQFLQRLDLHDQLLKANQIRAIRLLEDSPFVLDRQITLRFVWNLPIHQF